MSRRMVGPNRWVDEGPRTPYPGPRAVIGGSVIVAVQNPVRMNLQTAADRARKARAHAKYNERQRALRDGAA